MKKRIESLTGKAMVNLVRKLLKRTGVLDKRIRGYGPEDLLDELNERLQKRGMKKQNRLPGWQDFSELEIVGLPEASAIAIIDWYYCNKINGLNERENFKKIITIRKIFQEDFGEQEVIEKLNQVLEKYPQSLVEFIKAVVEAEHKVSLSSQNIEQLISEYKRTRKVI